MKDRGRFLQKKERKRIYLIIIISWSIRTSKKKMTADIFRLIDYLPYLSESSCYSILDFLFSHLNHSFTFFEYGGLIVLLQYIFISTFLLLDTFTVPFTVLFTFEVRSSMLSWVFKKPSFRHFDFKLSTIHVVIMN